MLIKVKPIEYKKYIGVDNDTSVYLQSIGYLPLYYDGELFYYMGENTLLDILKERRNSDEIQF